MEENKNCEHKWVFMYEEFYDGSRPGYYQDVFYCEKCLSKQYVKVDGEFHHKRDK